MINFSFKPDFNKKNLKIVFFLLMQLVLISNISGQITFEPQPSFFRTQREMPLVSIATTQDFYVTSYGAIKDDGLNDLAAIQAAIDAAEAAASNSKSVRVVFDKGTYDIMPPTGANHSLFVANDTNILFEGNDSEIRNHNPQVGFFEVRSCTNVIFKNFIFDYAVLPFTQGVVTSKNESNNTFTIFIENGFPAITESRFASAPEAWGVLKDATGKLKAGADNLYPYVGFSTTQFANTYRISTPSNYYTSKVEVGDYFVQIARHNGKTIFSTISSKNITYMNITIYASPAGSFNGQDNFELNILNCNVIPKPGSGRVQSGNADIVHVSGSYFGPWVQGCRFESITDDTVNLKHTKRDIIEVVSPTVLKVKFTMRTSDKLVVFNPRLGSPRATNISITKIENLGSNIFQITLDKEHNATNVGEHQTADKIYITNRASESFVFRNNTVKNSRRYGLLFQSSYAEVKNNTFENLSSSAIKMENGVDWAEGYLANNIEILNNTFINCGFDISFIDDPSGATITTDISKLKLPCATTTQFCGTEPVIFQGFQNINIKNNSFKYNKTGINLQNINGGTITGNTFVHNKPDITLKGGATANNILHSNSSNLIFDPLATKSFEDYNIKLIKRGFNLAIFNEGIDSSVFSILLFDNMGRKLLTKKSEYPITEFDISKYQKGLYILKIENDTIKTSKKVIF